jgi:Zn-dependent protease/predicted transcriptional regulator
MKASGTRIFRVLGIDVYLHFSWWFIFILLAYSLATQFFPEAYPGFSKIVYWAIGAIASLLLFISVLLHELTHSLVAKARKVNVESITLFFFGGVASLPSEDVKASTEFWMALSGPVFSLLLAGVLYFVHAQSLPLFWKAITHYLWRINLILGIFNLLPGYPLDGGRVFRSLLRLYYKDIVKATHIASAVGRFLAGLLMAAGFLSVLAGELGGVWFIFLGGFLWFVAKAGYQQVLLKRALDSIPLSVLIERKFFKLSPDDKFEKAVSHYRKSQIGSFLVVEKGKFFGVLDLSRVGKMSKSKLGNVLVGGAMIPSREVNALRITDHAYTAYRKFENQGSGVLPVISKGRLIGVVSRDKLKHLISAEMKFGD